MVARKINARDIIIQVREADGITWSAIGGLNSATPNPSENEETVDTTTFGSQGNYEQEIMQRGASLALEGFLIKDDTTGTQDPGQARCEVVGTLTGYASLGAIRFRHPMDAAWKVWPEATFTIGEQGGGNNDKTGWKCDIMRSGPSTVVAAP
ncbi:phage tail tube protein [Amycolatopsis sp. H20-H5]|uniref:phage tail tube protein n=1 Tax=Amycolatopsis sp. H20-H5 TaxID=3046309 RepID=UPI002DB5D11D|nr:hypothetical protein [Amycolatopsis sp. H20-H5]MEC3977905.1 hypothetical protein [Amycolatopsis sp. H20-H5]